MHSHVSNRRRHVAIKPLLLVSLLTGCFAGAAFAQETGEIEEKTLEPVVVTASRIEQLQKDAIPSTTVITSETIQNKKLADLPSLLKSEAGIDFARTGGAGQTTSVYMRGTNAQQVLILLDGIPMRDTTDAGTAAILSHIQPDQIDRIEVVRGNVSAIYGSGAMGGSSRFSPSREPENRQPMFSLNMVLIILPGSVRVCRARQKRERVLRCRQPVTGRMDFLL
ncbi:TonB-dependent receptor plug domain-containing protein [Oxalobacter aliiformigenes]|uniref:TonB-dependent receptor n=1 Tax=Oxalobacter aliiformigenes TaxID=2946593 RepID=UPI0022AEF9B4|nr:TonB-dependent receptor plug domain-containing protein [Oxalobacter aliiformigenes]WAV98427.1 TonB-dependent receptor plug domain-containing protein [Oxalobacter aliiformigenes]